MTLLSRFPLIVSFLVIALITSLAVSFYTYQNLFYKQIEQTRQSELHRINQRMTELQGTINDFNRRKDYNAIHREVSRLSSDSTLELIAIMDEHGHIKYSSFLEYRNTPIDELPELKSRINQQNNLTSSGFISIDNKQSLITGFYPLDIFSHRAKNKRYPQSILYAQFNISHILAELRYRQQQEIIQIILIYFSLLIFGFYLLYLNMRTRIKAITDGISQLSDGNYSSRINLPGGDEFCKISSGFDSMAEKLQSQNINLTKMTDQLRQQHKEIVEQERNLGITLNSIGDAVIATDPQGHITRMNPVAEKLTGWTLEDAAGISIKQVFDIIDASTRQAIENPIDKVMSTGQTIYLSNQTTLISKNGQQYHIADSASPIRGEDDIIQGMVLIFNDVSEQYRLKLAAENSKNLLISIMDNSPAVIYVKDLDGRFTFVNRQFETIFKLSRDDILGKSLFDLFPQHIAEVMYSNDVIVKEQLITLETEVDAPHDDGIHTYSSIKFPLFDEANNINAVCGISTDITERKQHEQQLLQNQKMDALGKLTGGIAHDYNNMLGVIMGYSQLLLSSLQDDPKLEKYTEEILHAGERGRKLTKKLLAFSRPQQNDHEAVNINKLIQDREDMLKTTLTARINLSFRPANHIWPVWINAGDLEDAILNICINAMQAMNQNGLLSITTSNIRLKEKDASKLELEAGEYVCLSFTDSGIGMDKQTMQKMFDPFFTSKQQHGTGLGLTQVYGLMKNTGGGIHVESAPDKGTCISLYFPRHLDNIEPNPDTPTDEPEPIDGTETILVVDDEPALRELTADILQLNGYRVMTADSAKQAIELLNNYPIDLILSDVIMPEIDGYQLADQARQINSSVKIQLVSGFTESSINPEIKNTLDQDLLHKPVRNSDLLARVRELLDKD